MQSIVLPDETRYAEQMRSEVLPALAACSQRIPCTGEGGAALNVRLYVPAGAPVSYTHLFCPSPTWPSMRSILKVIASSKARRSRPVAFWTLSRR